MPQAIIHLGEHEDRVLTIVKGKYGFNNKSDAINFIIDRHEQEFLEPKLRPEYLKRINRIHKEKGVPFKDINQLQEIIAKSL